MCLTTSSSSRPNNSFDEYAILSESVEAGHGRVRLHSDCWTEHEEPRIGRRDRKRNGLAAKFSAALLIVQELGVCESQDPFFAAYKSSERTRNVSVTGPD